MEGAIAGKATRMAAACAVAAAAIVGCIALAPAEESAEALVPDAGIEQAEGKTFLIGDSRFTSVMPYYKTAGKIHATSGGRRYGYAKFSGLGWIYLDAYAGKGYSWYKSTALPHVNKLVKKGKHNKVAVLLSSNDGNHGSYGKKLVDLLNKYKKKKNWNKTKVYVITDVYTPRSKTITNNNNKRRWSAIQRIQELNAKGKNHVGLIDWWAWTFSNKKEAAKVKKAIKKYSASEEYGYEIIKPSVKMFLETMR